MKINFLVPKLESNSTFAEAFSDHTKYGLIELNCFIDILNCQNDVVDISDVHVSIKMLTTLVGMPDLLTCHWFNSEGSKANTVKNYKQSGIRFTQIQDGN